MNYKIFLVLPVVIFHNYLFGQWKDLKNAIPSPNAASLGLYGEMPVSYFTGVPNISVPLYEVKGNKLDLPITMNYHASGLRPEIHPGWVGNGWSLSAGGVITRKVNGIIDECQQNGSGVGKAGYYYNTSNLNNSTWNSQTSILTGKYGEVANPSYPFDADTEPDEFDFNFLGYSGKFFLDQTGQWQVQCDKALKVVFNPSDFVYPFIYYINGNFDVANVSPTFGKFTLIDEAGNQYIFGSTDHNNTAIEFSDIMSLPMIVGASMTATSWFLSQVISADGVEIINLNYERGPLTSQVGYTYTDGGFISPTIGSSFPNMTGYTPQCTENIKNIGLSGWVVFPVYLVSITMPSQNLFIDLTNKSKSNELGYVADGSNNDVYYKLYTSTISIPANPNYGGWAGGIGAPSDFPSYYLQVIPLAGIIPYYVNNTPDPVYEKRLIWLELNGIVVKNSATNSIIKNINFGYNNNLQKRLQLTSLYISDNANNPVQAYSFTYNNQTPLPAYLASYTDHWGFNNNITSPAFPQSNNFNQLHAPDATGVQTQAEILTSITYPTGGTSTFTYEPNTYSSVIYRDPVSQLQKGLLPTAESGVGGGVRIHKITNSDGYGNSEVKTYYYVNGYTPGTDPTTLPSSGVLDTKPSYSFINTGTVGNGSQISYQILSSNSVIPVSSNSAGTLIGYSKVIEQRSDNSYTLYEFTNHDNGYADLVTSFFGLSVTTATVPCTSLAFERGKLFHQAVYSVVNNVQSPVSDNTITYTTNTTQYSATALTTANALYDNMVQVCGGPFSVTRAPYFLYSNPFVPLSQTTKNYTSDQSGNFVTTSSILTYDQYKNLTQQQTTNSKGQAEITTYSYPASFSTSDPANPCSAMLSMNNVSTPIEKKVSLAGNLVNAELHTYKYIGPGKVYNDAVYNLEMTTPIPLSSITSTSYNGLGGFSFDGRYVQSAGVNYDPAGNVSSVNKTGNDPTAYLWDYGQQLPVAKITNANNIYSSGITNNVAQQTELKVPVGFSLNTNITRTINVGNSGAVNMSFAYINPYISGNNTSQLSWSLSGPNHYSGTLCAATTTSGTNCGILSNTAALNNITPGSYTLVLTLTSCIGFQNYYGYSFDIQYPVNIYSAIIGQNDVAYTSFEYNTANDLTYGIGNWSGLILANIRPTGTAVTGNKYYLLTGSTLSKSALQSTQTYIVSYWSDNGPYSVSGSQSTTKGATIGSGQWTYYEHVVTNSSTISISGSGDIDELRIHPQGAQMTTYTYTPLVGMTSQCDANDNIIYYSYDSFNRLKLILDKDKNILKEFDYQY